MADLDAFMPRFCAAGARAVCRYFEVSGLVWPPEYFAPAFILDALGHEITMTLETNFEDLTSWNADVRNRHGLAPQAHNDKLLRLMLHLGRRPRIDMALFEGEEKGEPKDKQDFLALIEVKKGWFDAGRVPGKISDRDKLLILLEHIDTCPWGIVCGWASAAHRDWQKSDIQGTNDRWYESDIVLPRSSEPPLFFGARLFKRSSDPKRLAELEATVPY